MPTKGGYSGGRTGGAGTGGTSATQRISTVKPAIDLIEKQLRGANNFQQLANYNERLDKLDFQLQAHADLLFQRGKEPPDWMDQLSNRIEGLHQLIEEKQNAILRKRKS